jgi:hypothetical protein
VSVPSDVRLRTLHLRIEVFDEGRPAVAWIAGFVLSLGMLSAMLDRLGLPIALGVALGLAAGVALGFVVHMAFRALTTRWKREFIALAGSAHMPRAELLKHKRT